MKKMIIVEDRPWVVKNAVVELGKRDVSVEKIIYYPNSYGDEADKQKQLDEFKKTTKTPIITIKEKIDVVKEMERCYEESDVVFLMDYDLENDLSILPDERFNLRYVKRKEYEDNMCASKRRIWFYTTTGMEIVNYLQSNFPDQVVSVESFRNGMLQWDEKEIMKILE